MCCCSLKKHNDFCKKRTKCKNSRLINGKVLRQGCSKCWQFRCLLPVLSDSPCNDALSSVPPWRQLWKRKTAKKTPKTLRCTRSTPFICTSHAYRKRNKVYTQCCCCIFFLFIHIRRKIYKLSGGFSLCCLCVCFFWRRMGRFTAVNVVYARVFFFFFFFPSLAAPRLTFW